MANFIMYGFKRDEDFAALSTKAIARLLREGERLIFLDDVFNPVSDEFRKALEETPGVEYAQTYHPRNGNLIGPKPCVENFNLLAQYAHEAKDSIVVKVDCDTMVLGRDWLDQFAKDDRKLLAGGFMGQVNYMFGLCYAIKAPLADWLVKDAKVNPPWIHCYEDYEVSHRVHAANPSCIKRYHLADPRGSKWVCLSPKELSGYGELLAEVVDVNRTDDRNAVLRIMRTALKNAYALDERQKEAEAAKASTNDEKGNEQ